MKTAQRATERVDQKRRTREKLLAAARSLVEEGRPLTVAAAAGRADLAEATAYRYYRNPRSLLRDALSIDWPGLDDLLAALSAMPDVADRAGRAAEEMARFVLARETSIRLLFASTDPEPRQEGEAGGLPRASFRRRLIEIVLRDEERRLGADLPALRFALTVVVSPHAVLNVRDAALLAPDAIPGALGAMARRLFDGPAPARPDSGGR